MVSTVTPAGGAQEHRVFVFDGCGFSQVGF